MSTALKSPCPWNAVFPQDEFIKFAFYTKKNKE